MNLEPRNSNIFPLLKTDNLALRKLVAADAAEIFCLRSDEEVNRFLDRPKSITLDDAKAFIDKITTVVANGESYYWAITLKDINILIGTICLWHVEPEKQRAEIGYELQTAWQGMGLMQEAVKTVMEYAFEVLNLKILIACSSADNEKSRRLLERCGFARDLAVEEEFKDELNGGVFYSVQLK